jgi:thiamine-phosphate pyrophosphorylase
VIDPGLYVIVHLDWHLRDRRSPVEFLKQVLAGGCSAVQLRFKGVDDARVLEAAGKMRRLTARRNIPFIVNDRPDLALLCGADGVHVGQDDIPARDLARAFPDLAIGLSTHTPAQVSAARRLPLSYIGFGPVFGTQSKQSLYPATGLDGLHRAVSRSRIPLVAIGGIDGRNIRNVAAAGARRAAVMSCLYASPDPRAEASALHGALLGACGQRKRCAPD